MEELLARHGWVVRKDDDGDLTGRWGEELISFLIRGDKGEILNVMGYMVEDLPMERLDETRFALEEWHRERIWPTCFWRENDDAGMTFSVGGAHMIDWDSGVSDSQLEQQVLCAMTAISEAFEDVRRRLGLGGEDR